MKIPEMVCEEIARYETKLQWPKMVPKYLEFQDATGKELFCQFTDLTIALCEQATEFHSRRAVLLLRRWHHKPVRSLARHAAMDIVKARVIRCRFLTLIGKTESTEDHMPFAHGMYEE